MCVRARSCLSLISVLFITHLTDHFLDNKYFLWQRLPEKKNVVRKQSVGTYTSVGITASTIADKALSLGSNFASSNKCAFKKRSTFLRDIEIFSKACRV